MTQNQTISATSKYIRISPSKVDLIIKKIEEKHINKHYKF